MEHMDTTPISSNFVLSRYFDLVKILIPGEAMTADWKKQIWEKVHKFYTYSYVSKFWWENQDEIQLLIIFILCAARVLPFFSNYCDAKFH